jgi:DNA-directed RNA polymerase subunit RPC12/RpoP
MKCPKCKANFIMQDNIREEMDKTFIICPECSTRFKLRALEKLLSLNTIVVLILAGIPIGLLPEVFAIPIFLIIAIFYARWVFKLENIVPGS